MGANSKNYQDHQRTFINTSPSNNNKNKSSPGSQRPSPSKSINIKTPPNNKGNARNSYYNNTNSNNAARLSLSGSPTSSFFAGSKCFESPSPDTLPLPPTTWMTTTISNNSTSTNSSTTTNPQQVNRVRKALILPMENNDKRNLMHKNSCAMEYATAFSSHNMMTNDHFTQSLKLLLNVNA